MRHLTKEQKNLLKRFPAHKSNALEMLEMMGTARAELGDDQADVLRDACGLLPCPVCKGRPPRRAFLGVSGCWSCEHSGAITRKDFDRWEADPTWAP